MENILLIYKTYQIFYIYIRNDIEQTFILFTVQIFDLVEALISQPTAQKIFHYCQLSCEVSHIDHLFQNLQSVLRRSLAFKKLYPLYFLFYFC